jgi:multicomponent Na+:H+ antiporter subunit C
MRNLVGLLILSNAINLLIFTAGGTKRGFPPIIGLNLETLRAPYADPLPQALILTAIVIGFGVFAFFLILTLKTYETNHSDDMDTLTEEL